MWVEPKLSWQPIDNYNFEDFNRVENNTAEVVALMKRFTTLPSFVFVTNRTMEHIDFADSLNRIESIQDTLQQRVTPIGWLKNKTDWKANDAFSFVDANRLEQNVNILYKRYTGNLDARPNCGMITCGEAFI